MQLLINQNNEIIGYSNVGGFTGGTDFTGELPEGFKDKFKPKYYILNGIVISVNPGYIEPSDELPMPALTQQDEINAHLFKMNLDLQLELRKLKSNE